MFSVLELLKPFYSPFDFMFFSGGIWSLRDAGLFRLVDLVEYCGITFCWVSSVFLKISCTSCLKIEDQCRYCLCIHMFKSLKTG